MFTSSDLDADISHPEGALSKGLAIKVEACMLPIYLGFSAFGLVGKGTAAACAVATLIIAVGLLIKHVSKAWFWAVIIAVAVVKALLIAYVPLPNKTYMFPIVAPLGYLEYVLVGACIRLVEKRASVSA